jgi:hypothetical protein
VWVFFFVLNHAGALHVLYKEEVKKRPRTWTSLQILDNANKRWELVSTRMAAAHGLVRAPVRSRVRAPSSATLRLELLLLNTIPQGSSPAGLVFF